MTSIRRLAYLQASLLAAAACGPSDLLGPRAGQGIDGVVTIGPMCPVQTLDDPCPDQPYQAWIEVVTASGAVVTSVYSDEHGEFRIGLRPGAYVVRPESLPRMGPGRFPFASEQSVVVQRGRYAAVLVSFDSGIR